MPLLLLLLSLSALFLLALTLWQRHSVHMVLTRSVLVFSAFLLLLTEILSVFRALNRSWLMMIWGTVLLLLIVALFRRRKRLNERISVLKAKSTAWYLHRPDRKWLLLFMVLSTVLLAVQGLIYPPNNYDSMTYHLARLPEWLAHKSVGHYPTHIYRQLYQPPFSGYFLFHVNVLAGHDYFSNAVQLFYFICTGTVLSLLMSLFGLRMRSTGLLLLFTLPAAVLQASGSTNNIIDAYFIASSVYFAARAVREPLRTSHFAWLGLSLGLAAMNKGTAYVYLLPLAVLSGFLLFRSLLVLRSYRPLLNGLLTLSLFCSLSFAFFTRNIQLSGHPLGLEQAETAKYRNDRLDLPTMASNALKNLALHMGPYPLSRWSQRGMEKLHRAMGSDISDPKRNFDAYPFEVPDSPNFEDCAPNPLHLTLLITSFLMLAVQWMRKRRPPASILLYACLLLLQWMVFSTYLKWQPWHSRNHIPFFVLSLPLMLYVFRKAMQNFRISTQVFFFLLMAYALAVLLLNRTRPLITLPPFTENIKISDSRTKKYFTDRQKVAGDGASILQLLRQSGFKRIGLILDWNEYEYPFFSMAYSEERIPVHIMVAGNPSAALDRYSEDVDCIISNKIYQPYIDYRGKRYFCRRPGSDFIALYTPLKHVKETPAGSTP